MYNEDYNAFIYSGELKVKICMDEIIYLEIIGTAFSRAQYDQYYRFSILRVILFVSFVILYYFGYLHALVFYIKNITRQIARKYTV